MGIRPERHQRLFRQGNRVRDFFLTDLAANFLDAPLHVLPRPFALFLFLPPLTGLFGELAKDLQLRKLLCRAPRGQFRFLVILRFQECADLLLPVFLLLPLFLLRCFAPSVAHQFLQLEFIGILAQECVSLGHGVAKLAAGEKGAQRGQLFDKTRGLLLFPFRVENQHLQVFHRGILRILFRKRVNDLSCLREFLLPEQLSDFA